VRFANGIEFSFTGSSVTSLAAGQSVLVVKNLAAFTSRYGGGSMRPGSTLARWRTAARTSASTTPRARRSRLRVQQQLVPDHRWRRLLARHCERNRAVDTWGLKASWRPSGSERGSPGQTEPAPIVIAPIRINEVMTHTDPPAVDTVELYNPTTNAVNLRGWFLSDDRGTPRKFRVSTDVIIPAGGYVVFDESQFNTPRTPRPASPSVRWAMRCICFPATPTRNLTGYVHGFAFGAARKRSFLWAPHDKCGRRTFVSQTIPTPSSMNSGPKVASSGQRDHVPPS